MDSDKFNRLLDELCQFFPLGGFVLGFMSEELNTRGQEPQRNAHGTMRIWVAPGKLPLLMLGAPEVMKKLALFATGGQTSVSVWGGSEDQAPPAQDMLAEE